MANTSIEFIIRVQDELSPQLDVVNKKLDAVSKHVKTANKHAESLGHTLREVAEAVGIIYAVEKVREWGAEAVNKTVELRKQTALLELTIKNTNSARSETLEQLKEEREELEKHTQYNATELMAIQTRIASKGFEIAKQKELTQLAVDYGAKFKLGAEEAGEAVLRMQEQPRVIIRALAEAGKLVLGEQQKLQKLLNDPATAAATAEMLKRRLEAAVKGAAQGVRDADPFASIRLSMEHLMLQVGPLLLTVFNKIAPILETIIDKAQSLVDWMRRNKEILKDVAIAIGLVAIAVGLFLLPLGIQLAKTKALVIWEDALKLKTDALAAAQWLLNVALNANPIGLVIIAIAALAALVYEMVKHWNSWGAAMSLVLGPLGLVISFIKTLYDHWEAVKKSFASDGIKGAFRSIGAVLVESILMPIQQILEIAAKIPGIGKYAAEGAAKIQNFRNNTSLAYLGKFETKGTTAEHEKSGKEADTKKTGSQPTPSGDGILQGTSTGSGKSGPTQFYITIQKMIGVDHLSTTNMHESTAKVGDSMLHVLTNAINNHQNMAQRI